VATPYRDRALCHGVCVLGTSVTQSTSRARSLCACFYAAGTYSRIYTPLQHAPTHLKTLQHASVCEHVFKRLSAYSLHMDIHKCRHGFHCRAKNCQCGSVTVVRRNPFKKNVLTFATNRNRSPAISSRRDTQKHRGERTLVLMVARSELLGYSTDTRSDTQSDI